jgi:phosphoribosyl-AMP cyclohydrolase
MDINTINFTKMNGLVPAVIQDSITNEIYMLGYMNKESLKKSMETNFVYFWSRSRNKLWKKGEESGNKLKIECIYIDCDRDTLLIKVVLVGKCVCHTGKRTCFNKKLPVRSLDFARDDIIKKYET